MYYTPAGFGDKPEEEISWSLLLSDEAFIGAMHDVVSATAVPT